MLDTREARYYVITEFKKAIQLEKKNAVFAAIYQYGSVLDICYHHHQEALKYICIYAIRALIRLSQQTNYGEPGISMAIHHSEQMPWHFEKEQDPFIRLIMVEILCAGISLCLDCKEKWKNSPKAEKMFKYLQTNYQKFPEKKIQKKIMDAKKLIDKQKK